MAVQRPTTSSTLNSDNLRSLYAWLDAVPLSRPKRNIADDFSDGVMMAEVLSYFVPRLIDLSVYPTANLNDNDTKISNWRNLNQNVFATLDIRLSDYTINLLVAGKPGMIEQVLWELRRKLMESVQNYTNAINITNPTGGYSLRDISGFNEISRDRTVWKALITEFLGTLIFVFVGCASCIEWEKLSQVGHEKSPLNGTSVVQIAFAFGIAAATVSQALGHISGAHINPAVTIGFLVALKIKPIRAILYIVCQCAGALAGAAILKGLTPGETSMGVTVPHADMYVAQVFGIELVITFILVLSYFGSFDAYRNDVRESITIAIGLTYTACHLAAYKLTGSSMNPARTLGPAILTGIWTMHWVYWIGPIVGGAIAGTLYLSIFRASKPS